MREKESQGVSVEVKINERCERGLNYWGQHDNPIENRM